MAGHSHSRNIIHRKNRQSQLRSEEHQRARKKIEMLIQQEGKVSEKSLSIAREHSFSKERVYQIWEKWKQKQSNQNDYFSKLYQAPFAIILYCEGKEEKATQEAINFLSKEMQWNEISPSNPAYYFRKVNLLEIEIKDSSNNFEEYLLINLPSEIINKIEHIEIKNNQAKVFFSEKEVGEEIENLLLNNYFFIIKSKKSIWQPLIFQELISLEAKTYAKNLKQKLTKNKLNIKFFTNILL
ncbi:MAG: hypothetical protein MRERV_76c004 [Mycoplasmataceae bacterium RV_VA103A]|nr:MAG: hypothetical protein MRERV_76c004 [Mycoplasmataceae bacterium RV_VA103A]